MKLYTKDDEIRKIKSEDDKSLSFYRGMKQVWDDPTLSLEAMVLHAVLLDRLCLSYRPENITKYTDEKGNVWCNYDLDELTKKIKVNSHNTTKKYIDELEKKGYIFVSRLRGTSNRYYIANLNEVSQKMTSSEERESKSDYLGSQNLTPSASKSNNEHEEVKKRTEGSQNLTMGKSKNDSLGSQNLTTNDTDLNNTELITSSIISNNNKDLSTMLNTESRVCEEDISHGMVEDKVAQSDMEINTRDEDFSSLADTMVCNNVSPVIQEQSDVTINNITSKDQPKTSSYLDGMSMVLAPSPSCPPPPSPDTCECCGRKIPPRVAASSMAKFGLQLCIECQVFAKKQNGTLNERCVANA
jgi:DNA-binding MarR family transcriptional regulator